MRYIDADKLALHLSDYALQESPNWGANGYGNQDAYDAINECIKAIDDQPTADVRENVKGKWIIKTDGFVIKRVWGVCSECGNTLDFSGVNAGRGDANFCPNCGADMRGDQT